MILDKADTAFAMAPGHEVVMASVQELVDRRLTGISAATVLDAGCGARRYFDLPADARRIGLDRDAEALARNSALDERIVGDIETFPLSPEQFDLIVCWDVLEHVPHPGKALENLVRGLGRGGLLVIGGPNALSLKGLVTWMTPFWFHRLLWAICRKLLPGAYELPMKTYRRPGAIPGRITAWTREHRLSADYLVAYESWMQVAMRRQLRLSDEFWARIRAGVRRLTFGFVDPGATDVVLVFTKG